MDHAPAALPDYLGQAEAVRHLCLLATDPAVIAGLEAAVMDYEIYAAMMELQQAA